MTNESTVFIVDDDRGLRNAMELLMRSVALPFQTFGSADEFLSQHQGDSGGCLVLDIRMPGLGGLELQDRLIEAGSTLPIIFITAHGDVPMAVEAIQKGAFDFIQKPFRHQDLLERIREALQADVERRVEREKRTDVSGRLEKLTPREREVMKLVVTGKPNKIIAFELDLSQRTVEIHRARVMKKMGAGSLADLVRMDLDTE